MSAGRNQTVTIVPSTPPWIDPFLRGCVKTPILEIPQWSNLFHLHLDSTHDYAPVVFVQFLIVTLAGNQCQPRIVFVV